MIAAPLGQQLAQVQLGLHAALHADDHQPAAGGQRVQVPVQIGRSHDVQDDVGAVPAGRSFTAATKSSVRVVDGHVGAELAAAPVLAGRAVVITRAPRAVASWMANVPMPLAPPWTSRVSRLCSRPSWNTLDHTVQATSGSAAASTRLTPFGTGRQCAGVDRDPLRVAAAGQQGAHLVAQLPAGDVRPDRPDHARSTPSPGTATRPAAVGRNRPAATDPPGSPRPRRPR